MKGILLLSAAAILVALPAVVPVFADPSPTGSPGQPGAFNGTTCQVYTVTPGNSANAAGSVFNPNGQAGTVYAGNPGTASLANSNSPHSVSEYDIACFQQTTHP